MSEFGRDIVREFVRDFRAFPHYLWCAFLTQPGRMIGLYLVLSAAIAVLLLGQT